MPLRKDVRSEVTVGSFEDLFYRMLATPAYADERYVRIKTGWMHFEWEAACGVTIGSRADEKWLLRVPCCHLARGASPDCGSMG